MTELEMKREIREQLEIAVREAAKKALAPHRSIEAGTQAQLTRMDVAGVIRNVANTIDAVSKIDD